MHARPLDPHDDAQMRAFYDVSWRAEMEDDRPWNGHWTYDELASTLCDTTPEHRLPASRRTTGTGWSARASRCGPRSTTSTRPSSSRWSTRPPGDAVSEGRSWRPWSSRAVRPAARRSPRTRPTPVPRTTSRLPCGSPRRTASTSPTPRSSASSDCRWTRPSWSWSRRRRTGRWSRRWSGRGSRGVRLQRAAPADRRRRAGSRAGHLLGVRGIDPRVVLARGEQHGWVPRSVAHVVVRRVVQQRLEDHRIFMVPNSGRCIARSSWS